jgi:hypothetical protein
MPNGTTTINTMVALMGVMGMLAKSSSILGGRERRSRLYH